MRIIMASAALLPRSHQDKHLRPYMSAAKRQPLLIIATHNKHLSIFFTLYD